MRDDLSNDSATYEITTAAQAEAAKKYRVHYADTGRKLALLGMDDLKIAKFFGVNISTMREWQRTFPEFGTELRQGREMADAAVINAVHQSAVGYSRPAVKFFVFKRKDSDEPEIIEKAYIEHFPPNISAAVFWMTNRQGDLWKNATHQHVDQQVEVNVSGISSLLDLVRKAGRQPVTVDSELIEEGVTADAV